MSPESHDPESLPPEGWTEPQVEQLLDWFFARELPAGLREPVPTVWLRRTSPTVQSAAGRWLVPLCAMAVLGSGWLLWHSSPPKTIVAVREQRASVVELETSGLPWRVEQVSFPGKTGSFEQTTVWHWTSNSYFEPGSGTWVEWSAPELVIDVEPAASAALPQGI